MMMDEERGERADLRCASCGGAMRPFTLQMMVPTPMGIAAPEDTVLYACPDAGGRCRSWSPPDVLAMLERARREADEMTRRRDDAG